MGRDCYLGCLRQFSQELWDDDELERLGMAAYEQRGGQLPLHVFEHTWKQIHALREVPWWKRQRVVTERWSPATKVYVAGMLLKPSLDRQGGQWLDVPVRGWLWLNPDELEAAPGPHEISDEWCAYLMSTVGYCQWIQAGGDPDLGRYIAAYYEVVLGDGS